MDLQGTYCRIRGSVANLAALICVGMNTPFGIATVPLPEVAYVPSVALMVGPIPALAGAPDARRLTMRTYVREEIMSPNLNNPSPTAEPTRRPTLFLAAAVLLAFALSAPTAAAGLSTPAHGALHADTLSGEVTDYGLSLRGGLMAVPQGIYEAFVERASSGTSRPGFGAELVRRRGDFEVAFGVGYDELSPEDGLWLEDGDQPPEDPPYLVEFEDLAWVTVGPTFMWHSPVGDTERVALRYGAGVAVAIPTGDAYRTSTECGTSDLDSCEPITDPEDGRLRDPVTKPSVLPLASLLGGFQFRLHPRANLNVEVGFRTVGYAGGSLTVFF